MSGYIQDPDGYIIWSSLVPGGPTVTPGDGGDAFSPLDVTAWRPNIDSANIVHQLLDGTTAVKLVGDRLRSGEFQMIFNNDVDAHQAWNTFRRPTTFILDYPERPVVNMTFARTGSLSTVIHDVVRKVWEFSVGFQEIDP